MSIPFNIAFRCGSAQTHPVAARNDPKQGSTRTYAR